MPLYQVDIEKLYRGEYWTNRYVLNAASIDEAHAVGGNIVAYERAIHLATVDFTKYRTSDFVKGNDLYIVGTLGLKGQALTTTDYLPLFCCCRVDFSVGYGRPSRKYLRLPLEEANQNDGGLVAAFRDSVNTKYIQPLVALAAFVDVDGQKLVSGSVFPQVAMRQLRRGSKRKLQPVLT